MQFEEFADCLEWWHNREKNERVWKVAAKDVLRYDEQGALASVNLDIKNPNAKEDFEHLPPEQLADDVLKKIQRQAELMVEIKQALSGIRR
jgi:type I restriction enzyme M protein